MLFSKENKSVPISTDLLIEKGVLALLIFTPLAFGTVQPWSIAIFEIAAFILFSIQLGRGKVGLPADRPAKAVAALFLAFAGLVVLQYFTVSIYPQATLDELLRLLACAAMFLVVAGHFRTRERIATLVRTILFMGTFLVIFAVVQKLTWNGRIFWFYPVGEHLRSGAGIWGPYINRNHFAGYLAMAVPLGLGLLLYTSPGRDARSGGSRARRAGRFLADAAFPRFVGLLMVVLVMTAGIFMSLSRGGVTAFAVSGVCFLALARLRRATRRTSLPLALTAAAVAAVILIPSWGRIAARFETVAQGRDIVRQDVWRDTLGILRDHPLLGTGLGTFEQAYPRYQTKYPRLLFDHAHNDYLELATDTGAIGSLTAAAIAALFLIPLAQRWRDKRGRFGACIGAGGLCSCVAIAVHSATDFNLHITANAFLFTVVAAMTRTVLFTRVDGNAPAPVAPVAPAAPAPPHRLRPRAAAALCAGLLLCYLPAKAYLADRLSHKAERLLDNPATPAFDTLPIFAQFLPNYRQAITALEKAAALEPNRSAWPRALAELNGKLGVWAKTMTARKAPLPAGALPADQALATAVAQAARAVALEPTNANHRLALSRLLAARSPEDPRAAEQLRAAAAAAPGSAPMRRTVAQEHLRAGRRQEALEEARALVGLDDGTLPPGRGRQQGDLAAAFDIAWRATGDGRAVREIAPATEEGRAAAEVFLKNKPH